MPTLTKRLIRWAVIVVLVLLIPMVLTIINPTAHWNGGQGGGWDWSPGDFVFGFVVIFGAALTYELVARKMPSGIYRFAVGLAVVTALVLIWINAAVGVIGDGDLDFPNGLYFVMLAAGFVSALITRFKPRAMASIMFGLAAAQMVIPVIALAIGWNDFAPGILRVFIFSAFFALLFVGAGMLFRRASD